MRGAWSKYWWVLLLAALAAGWFSGVLPLPL